VSAVHRLVLADIERSRAQAHLNAERLRSKREGISTVGTSGHGRALQVAKMLREAEAIVVGWNTVLVAVLAEDDVDPDVGDLLNVQVIETEPDPVQVVGFAADPLYTGDDRIYRCTEHPFKWTNSVEVHAGAVPDGAKCDHSACGKPL
jgi:hypothetical protein